jgi:cytochrome c553
MNKKGYRATARPPALAKIGPALSAAGFALFITTAVPAVALECPVAHARTDNSAIIEPPARIAELAKQLDADQTGRATTGTILALKQKYSAADFTDLANYMLTAYCLVVVKDASLSDEEKKDQMNRYAEQVEEPANQ